MTEPQVFLAENGHRILAELLEFARIPSISTDARYKADVQHAANWVAEQLRQAGPLKVQVYETSGHPLVYAEWLEAGDAPTLLIYGHYDVQPPDPLDQWKTPPFEPTVHNGRIYGRGVSDDKAPMFIPIKVAQAYLATEGRLPLNVKFLFEGEEEIGSPSLDSFVRERLALLNADFMLSADGAMWRADVPTLSVSSRGMVAFEVTVRGPSKDLHSGRHGGAVANPLHAMATLLASLHDKDAHVAVKGFYDDVEELGEAQRQVIQTLPFDEAAYLKEVGSPALCGEAGYSTLERQWNRPTLEINGMWGGYQGEGSKTVLPSEAHAKITCRLVPRQQPEDVMRKIAHHLEQHKPTGVTLDIGVKEHGALAYRLPEDHLGLRVAQQTLREIYQQEPLLVGMGGSVPICETFQRYLGMDTVFFSFAVGDEDIHAPNEFFRVERLYQGLQAWALYWRLLSQGMSKDTAPIP